MGGRRQAVAERTGYWYAEASGCRCDPEIAGGGQGKPGTDTGAGNRRDCRHPDSAESTDHLSELPLIVHSLLARSDITQLLDIGARDERFGVRSPEEHDPHCCVGVGTLTGRVQTLIHRPRHGIAAAGPVKSDVQRGAVEFDEHVLKHPPTPKFTVRKWQTECILYATRPHFGR